MKELMYVCNFESFKSQILCGYISAIDSQGSGSAEIAREQEPCFFMLLPWGQ